MFAVKGWSVDPASLKPQTEIFKPSKSQDGEAQKSSKKRKRGHAHEAKQDPNIRADDVGRLWEQHIEGKGPSKSQKQRERKKQKLEHAGEEQNDQKEPQGRKSTSKEGKKTERSQDIVLDPKVEKGKHNKKSKENKGSHEEHDGKVKKRDAEFNGGHKQKEQYTAVKEVPDLSLSSKLTPMQSAMRQKLISARFRHLNQMLYTEPSAKAQELFSQNSEMFEDYHAGFRQQVSVWPENPLDKLIADIRRSGKLKPPKYEKKRSSNSSTKAGSGDTISGVLPRTHGACIIADLGCGDARLARTLTDAGDNTQLNLKLHSYDLHSPSPLVTKADISNIPLQDGSVDVAIFCLALMGTNWISFIEEAYRILHWKGELWVAEIKSRFGRVSKRGKPVEHSVGAKRKQAAVKSGKDAKKRDEDEVNEQEVLQTVVDGVPTNTQETDVSAFVDVLKRRGFVLKPPSEQSVDLRNKMFVKMEFIKAVTPTKGKGVPKEGSGGTVKAKSKFIPDLDDDIATEDESTVLKPCLYKIR